MAWWAWIILGFILLLGELVTPGGFYVLFFGIGAGLIGLAKLLGFSGPPWLEWLLFTGLSVVLLLAFRRRLQERFMRRTVGTPDDVDELVGQAAIAAEPIPPGGQGRVDMRGATWNARNLGAEPLAAGQSCVIEKVDGLVLGVRPQPISSAVTTQATS